MAGTIASLVVTVTADTSQLDTGVKHSTATLTEFEKSIGKVAGTTDAAAAALKQMSKPLDALAMGMSAAGKTSYESMAMIGLMSQSGRTELDRLVQAAKNVEPPLTMADRAVGLLKSSFGQFTAASLVANAVATITSKVGEFISIGAKLPAVEASFQSLTAGIHQNGGEMLRSMDGAAKGMVADYDLMLGANKAMLLGLPVTAKSMGELTQTARVLGKAMGQDATKSLDDLVTALGRSSPMILDNLGLTVKVGEANETYAAKLGKTADQLTESEKKMAFYEAAMEAARAKTAQLGDQTKTLGEIADTAWTKVGNVVSHTAADMNVGIGGAVSSVKNFATFLGDVASSGIGAAIQLARTRSEAEALAKSAHDVTLAIEPTTDVLAKYRDHLASLTTAVQKLTPEQEKLINQADDLHQSTTDIAKAMGISEAAVAVTVDTHHKAAEAAKEHAKQVKKLAEDIYQLGGVEQEFTKIADTARKANLDNLAANAKVSEELTKQQSIHAAAIIEQLTRTAAAQVEAAQLVRSSDFASAQYAIDQAKRAYESKSEITRMERELSLSRLNAAIADADAQFQATTAFIDQTSAFGKAEYTALADVHHLKVEQMKSDWQAAQAAMMTTSHGFFEGIQSGFKSLVSGMTGRNGVAGFMDNLGKGIVNGFGNIMSAGLTSVINMGVQLAVEGIKKIGSLIAGLFQSEETKKVNKPRDAFFEQFGGWDGLATKLTGTLIDQGVPDAGNVALELMGTLNAAKTESAFHDAEDAILAVFEASGLHFKKMAMGGSGTVTQPTWFLAGEAGPEDYAFSGANRRFGGRGDASLAEEARALRAEGQRESDVIGLVLRALRELPTMITDGLKTAAVYGR